MLRGMFSAITGLKNHQVKIDVIGNNIANVNTNGYKASRVSFQDVITQTLRGATGPTSEIGGVNAIQVGLGMALGSVENITTQGNLINTGVGTDMAIQGEGYFILAKGTQRYYTRDGAFNLDQDGFLVKPASGFKVQGWMADTSGIINTGNPLAGVQITMGQKIAATASTNVVFMSNLTATAGSVTLATGNTATVATATGVVSGDNGGTYTLTFTDGQANRIFGNTPIANDLGLVATTTIAQVEATSLAALGVTTTAGFSINGTAVTGLTTTSTIKDVINAINGQIAGVTAQVANDPANPGVWNLMLINNSGGAIALAGTDTSGIVTGLGNRLFNNGVAGWAGAGAGATALATDVTVLADFLPEEGGSTTRRVWSGTEAALTGNTGEENNTFGVAAGGFVGGWIDGLNITGTGGAFIPGNATITTTDNIHTTSIDVYDSLGDAHTLRTQFKRTAANTWSWTTTSLEGLVVAGGTGTMTFGTNGLLSGSTGGPITVTVPGANTMVITPNYGSGLTGVTQFESAFTTAAISQNGYTTGIMESFTISQDGKVRAFFTNGQQRDAGQVAMGVFQNPSGLTKVGDNAFQTSNNSGVARIGTAGTGGRGVITVAALELSNVDLATEFSILITTQRGFQANARLVTTSDEMLQDVIGLKR